MAKKRCPNCRQKLMKGESHVITRTTRGKPIYVCKKLRRERE